MPLKIEQLAAQLDRGLAPMYLLGGSEALLVQECRDQVCVAARDRGFTERQVLHVDRHFDWQSLTDAAAAPSLFASQKIIDLRMSTGKPGQEGARVLTDWAEDPDPDLLLVISCEEWDASSRKSKWARTLDKMGVRVDIWPIKPQEMPGWIRQRMERVGLHPARDAVMILAERLEGNLLAARQEIEKLLLLKGAGEVTAHDVLESVADSSRFDSFLLAERILAGKVADALRVAASLRRIGIPVQLVTGALYREFGVLESLRLATGAGESEQTAFRRLNVWPARQGPMRAAAQRLDTGQIARAFQRLSLIDRQSKGMADGDPWHSLDQLVCAMSAT